MSQQAVKPKHFAGRREILEEIEQLIADPNGNRIYYLQADGGTGKTWLLRQVQEDTQFADFNVSRNFIDLYNTATHSIVGLCDAIAREIRPNPDVPTNQPDLLSDYDFYRERLRTLRDTNRPATGKIPAVQPLAPKTANTRNILEESRFYQNQVASLERRVSKAIIDALKSYNGDKVFVLLFDTFERVRFINGWFFENLFTIRNPKVFVILAGRPSEILEDEEQFRALVTIRDLPRFSRKEIAELLEQRFPGQSGFIPETTINWLETDPEYDSNPLRIHLFCDHAGGDLSIKEPGWLTRIIQQKYCEHGNDADGPRKTLERRLISAMAILRRRFTKDIMDYLVRTDKYFDNDDFRRAGINGEQLLAEMSQEYSFVKPYDSFTSHLLHDEMQLIIYDLIREYNFELFNELFEIIVEGYYPNEIDKLKVAARRGDQEAMVQIGLLEAEVFGYKLDKAFWHNEALLPAIEEYKILRSAIISESRDYSYEEVVWNEMAGYLNLIKEQMPQEAYELCYSRMTWLYEQALFASLKRFTRFMLRQYHDFDDLGIARFLGFALFRLAEFNEAEKEFLQYRALAEEKLEQTGDMSWSYYTADYDRLLADLYRGTGDWDKALESYNRAFEVFLKLKNHHGIAATHNGRCYIYAQRGQFTSAKGEWENGFRRLDLLEKTDSKSDESSRLRSFLFNDQGTAYRNVGDFDRAIEAYKKALEIVDEIQQPDLIAYGHQHVGIVHVREGRQARSERDLKRAIEKQTEAFTELSQGLEEAGKIRYMFGLMHGYRRLARNYEEIVFLLDAITEQNTIDEELAQKQKALLDSINQYVPALAIDYDEQVMFRNGEQFADLTELWQKVVRLNEIGGLIAEDTRSIRDAIENWLNAALILVLYGETELADEFARRPQQFLTNNPGSELSGLYNALVEYHTAWKVIFSSAAVNDEAALTNFAQSLGALGTLRGIPYHIFQGRGEWLSYVIRHLPQNRANWWCEQLLERWGETGVLSDRAELRRMLEELMDYLLGQS